MTIAKHKTSASFSLNICVSMEQFELMKIYNNFVSEFRHQKKSNYLDPETITNVEMLDEHRPFFVNSSFEKCEHSYVYRLFKQINKISGIGTDYKRFTPNNVRAAYSTLCEKTYGKDSVQSKQLANYMAHSYKTASTHYVQRDYSEVTQRGEIASALMDASSKASRFSQGKNEYTDADPEKRAQLTVEVNETMDNIREGVSLLRINQTNAVHS